MAIVQVVIISTVRNYRFTIGPDDQIDSKTIKVSGQDLLHQVTNVLRLEPGHKEELSFIDGSGKVYYTKLENIRKNLAEFAITDIQESQRELAQAVTFYIPIIKTENFNWMLRKLVELGVQKIIPVKFARSQKQYIEAITKQKTRQLKIIQEATEQCEGARFAKLSEPIDFSEIKAVAGKNYFANERLSLKEATGDKRLAKAIGEPIALLVGPEGGLSDEEVQALEELGFEAQSLGTRLLKAETAAIALFCKMNFI